MSITSTVDVETETPDVEPTKWTFEDGVDVTGADTFHYTLETDPKANFENCIKECDNQSYCKAVVFNEDKTRCWGKLNAVGRRSTSGRSLYTKTDDVNGISEPWNFCSNDENILHPMCKTQLDEKCATNITDPACKGYKAYDNTEKTQLDEKCATNTTDEECAGYPKYDDAKAKRELDEYCATETLDSKCADYGAYKAARDVERLDAKCTENPTDEECADRPGYEEAVAEAIAKQNTFWQFRPNYDASGSSDSFHYHRGSDPKANLEVCLKKCNDQGDDCAGVVFDRDEKLCWGKRSGYNINYEGPHRRFYKKTLDPSNIKEPWNFCSKKINLSDPYCEPQLDAYCLNEVEDDLCAGYIAYDSKKLLDKKCETDTTDPECAGYDAYDNKQRLNTKCETNTVDEECADYPAYKKARLDEKCETNTTDPECAGYQVYDKARLDEKCATNTVDEECADYPAYKEKKRLDEKCATNTTDEECADYVAYKAERQCGSDDSIRDPLCFIKMCLKKDTPSICEQNPARDRIRSTAKEIDDEILEELCKDSKDSSGKFRSNAPSACRSTGSMCGNATKGGKCHGNACCSSYNWCAATTGGQQTAHCAYSDGQGGYRGRDGGKYDGTASRDEADKIARRPANFLDMVYQRVGDTPFCDIPANVLDPECDDSDLAMSIAKEIDDEILEELCKNSKKIDGRFKWNIPSACRTTATEWNPDDYDNMKYRCGYGEWDGDRYRKFGNTKCPNDHCCNRNNWCGAPTSSGQKSADAWCFVPDGKGGYRGRDNGKFDGDASRQEADKIARRPANFLDMVYQRVGDTPFCDIPANALDPECDDSDLATPIAKKISVRMTIGAAF